MLESVYEACLDRELKSRGVMVARQVVVPIDYKGYRVDGGYRLDLLVANAIIVEVKAVEVKEAARVDEAKAKVVEARVADARTLSKVTIVLPLHLLRASNVSRPNRCPPSPRR